jgi:uncharacterized protein (TIGR03435 family)
LPIPSARKQHAPVALAYLAAVLLVVPSQPACAQAAATVARPDAAANPSAPPAFDVVAIHLHQQEPHEHNSIWSSPFDGHFKAQNMSVVMLIHWAYEIPETRILDAPGWAASTFFNIDAETDPAVGQQLHNLSEDAGRKLKERMVQTLLADRFKLVTHAETRVLPIYALVVAKDGPRLGVRQESRITVNHGRDHMEVQAGNSLAILADELSKDVGRDVVDMTGIQGRYHLVVKWTPDNATSAFGGSGESSSALDSSGLSIFTALQEQLGLKLQPQKGPVPVLVIDHVELPSEN